MSFHAFADESARRSYLVAAALVDGTHLDEARRTLRRLRKPGQRRVHFAKESDSRRRTVVSALLGLDIRIRIYECVAPDVLAIAHALGGDRRALGYQHRPAHEEPLLWAADGAAWCYGAGGDWRRRVAPLLDKAVRLDLQTARSPVSSPSGEEPGSLPRADAPGILMVVP